VALDERLHPHGILLPVPVADDGVLATGRFDQHIREEQARLDLDRCDVGHVNRLLFVPDPPRRVLHDARRRDEHLGREDPVPSAEAAGAEDVARSERPAFAPDQKHTADEHDRHTRQRPPEPGRDLGHSARC
jgi:hypothetical protein